MHVIAVSDRSKMKKCECHAIKSTNECYSKNQTYMYVTGAFGITRVEANTGAIFATTLKSPEEFRRRFVEKNKTVR